MRFLSSESILKHREYLKGLELKYSVLEKSYPLIKGLELNEIRRLGLREEEKHEICVLFSEINLHKIFFSSFSEEFYRSEIVRRYFGSEANFLYEMESEVAKFQNGGFLVVFFDRKRRLDFKVSNDFLSIGLNCTPILAVDLFEHAYFYDYGFDKKRYVKTALGHLNLNKINDFCKTY